MLKPALAAVLWAIFVARPTSAGGPPPVDLQPVGSSQAEGEVRAIVARRFMAANAKRVDEIAPLYGYDEGLVVYREGRVIRGWIAYKKYWEAAITTLPPGFQVHFDDVGFRFGSDMAFVTARWATSYEDRHGKETQSTGLMTLILVRQPGAWHIVHEHISSIK